MPQNYLRWIIGIGAAIVVLLGALVVLVATDDGTPEAAVTSAAPTTEAPTVTEAPIVTEAPATSEVTTAPTVTEAPPPTVATTTTSTTTTTTTLPAGPGCADVGPIPGGATDVTLSAGDFDGDGIPDDFASYELGGTWYLWAELSNGNYRLVTPVDMPWSFAHWDGTPPDPVTVLTPHTLGDPRQVVSVEIYRGLGLLYALFAVEDCQIVALTDDAGTIPGLYRAMGPAHTDFPVCQEPNAVVQQAVLSCSSGEVSTCASLDASITPYTVSRDPARINPDGGGTFITTFNQTQYQSLVDDACDG